MGCSGWTADSGVLHYNFIRLSVSHPLPVPRTYNGIFPCFLGGLVARLSCSISSASMRRGRVSCGSMTSSTRGRPMSASTRAKSHQERTFKVGDLVSDLLVYHTKLVTYLSTKVSIECEVTPKDLAQMEVMYEDQAFKLMTQLEASLL